MDGNGRWAAARPAGLRSLSGYFDQALVGAARAEAQIAERMARWEEMRKAIRAGKAKKK